MSRLFACTIALVVCAIAASSQFNVRPGGTFDKRNIKNPVGFEVFSIDPDLSVEEYAFQLYVTEGGVTRTLQSQSGSQWWMWVDLLNLPSSPEPQLAVTLRVRHRYSGVAYNVSKVFPIRFIDPIAELGQLKWGSRWDIQKNLDPLIVGQEQGRIYYFGGFPKTARSATFAVIGPRGDTLNFTQATFGAVQTTMIDTAYMKQWSGGCLLRGRVFYDDGPAAGYVVERTIPDSIPAPVIEASAGFGPFRRGVDVQNTFVAKSLGPLCDSIQWILQYDTDGGQLRTIANSKRPYNGAVDTAMFTYNMRDIGQNAKLIVRATFGPYVPASQSVVELTAERPAPVFTTSFKTPRTPGASSIDTVTIDSLPPRIVNVRMILSDQSGAVIAQTTVKREAPSYIRTAKLTFKASDLRLGTYVVRVRALNDFKDDAPDYFTGFDVRDTSTFFLIADSWGPFTRGDSATISPAITDVRKFSGIDGWDKVVGRFVLVDTLNPTVPLYASPEIDLSEVKSRDSVVHWPDDSYVFGKPIETRKRIPTVDLPLTAQVRFERIVSYSGRPVYDQQLQHRVFMAIPPGVLTTTPRLDSTLTVTRNTPLTVKLTNIVPDAKAVRFSILGTKDPEPVIEELVALAQGQSSATITVNAGLLPVNAKLVASVSRQLGDNDGSELRRTVNTTADTLSMVAIPPIDTLTLDWDIDPSTRIIKGVVRLLPTLTFSKIPAQTRSIEIISYSDVGEQIDSMSIGVPYRNKFDSTLKISTQFPFRTFNVSALTVRYLSDGGPIEGVQYTKRIVSRPQPMQALVQKMNVAAKPPAIDKSEIRQGSNDLVSLSLRWRVNAPSSEKSLGYASSLQIDSVRMTILDCAGNTLDDQLVRPIAPMTNSGTVTDTLYPVRRLPLSTERVAFRMYSKSLTLPADGLLFETSMTLRTNPKLSIPLGTSYPSYRVSDTVTATLNQRMYVTNLDGITSIDSATLVDRSGAAVQTFPQLRAVNDTMWMPAFDFTRLKPAGGPYRVTGLVKTRTCLQDRVLRDTLITIEAPRVFSDPTSRNWMYSSLGWGPFQQGRAPRTSIIASFDPASFIGERASIADSLEISIVGFSRTPGIGIFTQDRPATFSYKRESPLPESARVRSVIDLNPFDTASSIALHVRWLQRTMTGVRVARDTLYSFPIRMLEFPDQIIEADTAGYEQSVLAGASGQTVMPSYYDFRMVPQSSALDRLTFSMLSSTEHKLDTTFTQPVSRDTAAQTSVFSLQRDVAQYPWPYVARDRRKVDINIGYQFTGATKPTKTQRTSISILPRAEWLNGAAVTLNGTATSNSIPVRATIPMPTATFNVALPMLGDLFYKIIGKADSILNVVVDANYNPTTGQFTMTSAPKGSTWVPSVSFFTGANYNIQVTAADGAKSDEFTALYRFQRAPLADNTDSIDNRELRLRSLSVTTSSGGVLNVLKWVYTFKKTVEKLVKTASLVASGGIVSFHPSFVLSMKTQQISTVNIGTEERGALMNIHEHKTVGPKTEPSEFPTSQAVGLTIIGGGAVEAELLGLIGLGVSYTQNYMFGSGSIFSNSIAARNRVYYPTALDLSSWINLELNLFFGLVNIELFSGRLTHDYAKNIMPSFEVFDESWGGLFKSSVSRPKGETVQVFEPIAKIYDETPFYRPAPSISANEHAMVSVHTEQSLLGSSGRIVLSSLDRSTHSLRNTVSITDNRNGIHDATVALFGNRGSALVAWVENATGATSTYRNEPLSDLMMGEDVHLAFYDAENQRVQKLPIVSNGSNSLDGKPTISVSDDTLSALIVWPSRARESAGSDLYIRRLHKEGGSWRMGDIQRLVSTPGYDHDVNVSAMKDGSYLVSWMNEDGETGAERVVSAVITDTNVVSYGIVASSDEAPVVSSMKMVGNGNMAVLLYSKSIPGETTQYNRTLDVYRFQNGTWSSAQPLQIGSVDGVYRHLEADMKRDGTFFAMIDAVDFRSGGEEQHKVFACVGSVNEPSSRWQVYENEATISAPDRSIWSMSAAIGPDSTLYVATQELDTIRGNQQEYGSGLQLGPSRCNAVIRAFRLTENNKITSVRFGNTPTSVSGDAFDDLERIARYRVRVVDPSPNPARDASTITLIVQKPTRVHVRLVDNLGNDVVTLFTGTVNEGIQGLPFETSGIASGRYSVVVTDELGTAGSVPLMIVR
ncbi:MAG: hypothetical protein FGM32_02910 [Candidatus Kapabacteria bacterium]|nr:hypothetical protein [Candidatus Kapabacteria bacterium]